MFSVYSTDFKQESNKVDTSIKVILFKQQYIFKILNKVRYHLHTVLNKSERQPSLAFGRNPTAAFSVTNSNTD